MARKLHIEEITEHPVAEEPVHGHEPKSSPPHPPLKPEGYNELDWQVHMAAVDWATGVYESGLRLTVEDQAFHTHLFYANRLLESLRRRLDPEDFRGFCTTMASACLRPNNINTLSREVDTEEPTVTASRRRGMTQNWTAAPRDGGAHSWPSAESALVPGGSLIRAGSTAQGQRITLMMDPDANRAIYIGGTFQQHFSPGEGRRAHEVFAAHAVEEEAALGDFVSPDGRVVAIPEGRTAVVDVLEDSTEEPLSPRYFVWPNNEEVLRELCSSGVVSRVQEAVTEVWVSNQESFNTAIYRSNPVSGRGSRQFAVYCRGRLSSQHDTLPAAQRDFEAITSPTENSEPFLPSYPWPQAEERLGLAETTVERSRPGLSLYRTDNPGYRNNFAIYSRAVLYGVYATREEAEGYYIAANHALIRPRLSPSPTENSQEEPFTWPDSRERLRGIPTDLLREDVIRNATPPVYVRLIRTNRPDVTERFAIYIGDWLAVTWDNLDRALQTYWGIVNGVLAP